VVEDLLGNITLHITRQGFHVAQFHRQVNSSEMFTRVEIIKFVSAVLKSLFCLDLSVLLLTVFHEGSCGLVLVYRSIWKRCSIPIFLT
jgi:hypothetical protein